MIAALDSRINRFDDYDDAAFIELACIWPQNSLQIILHSIHGSEATKTVMIR
jgi:hypothetical protein